MHFFLILKFVTNLNNCEQLKLGDLKFSPTVSRLLSHLLDPPHCNLWTSVHSPNELMVNCYCVGNPEVSTFYILVNNTLHTTSSTVIPSQYQASLNCFAENNLGQLSEKISQHYQPSRGKCLQTDVKVNITNSTVYFS